ncbi:MAG: hypothetical protein AAF560_02795 [Acidobacteriota bacterium]
MHPMTNCRSRNRALVWACWLSLALTLLMPWRSQAEQRDPKAVGIAQNVLAKMGGEEAWQGTRYLRFNFFGFRTHHWDRYDGRHRFEGKSRDGDSYLVLHNINTRQGDVWINGEAIDGEAKSQWLERAYGAWINDTYWLIMPYKLLDPGVNLAYDGEETIEGTTFDKLRLTFNSVGMTPGDTYWAYINRDSGLMERWAYHLESWEDDREPTAWQWLDWQSYGNIMLSSRRVKTDDGNERPLADIAVFNSLPNSVFESSDPVAAE